MRTIHSMLCCFWFFSCLGAPAFAAEEGSEVPPVPAGYMSETTLKAAYLMGTLKLIDAENVPVPDSVVEEKDIEYAKIGEKSLQMDVYRPKNLTGKAPAILFFHGGAWKGGKRDIMKLYCVRFAEKGYVTATASYRLTKEAPFPAAVQDAKCAVRWLKTNAERFCIDAARIAVSGNSAGGHLSLMVGYSSDVPEMEGECGGAAADSRVQAVVDFYGPVDLTTPFAQQADVVQFFLQGKTYQEAPELYRQASPIAYLTPDDPPTLILHGTIDSVVPIDQADTLEAKLKELHIPVTYEKFPGWPHTMDLAENVNKRAVYAMEKFLKQHLQPTESN